MRFVKMHGAGNDYIYVDCFHQPVPHNLPHLARTISDRRTGVGSDGLILIHPSAVADARMQMFNADGSEAEMCGNGIRCVAKYLRDHRGSQGKRLKIETARGILKVDFPGNGKNAELVRVDMGAPILEAERIPTTLAGNPPVAAPLTIGDRTVPVTCVSMGNPHCVVFVDEPSDDWVLTWGPRIEMHPAFPRRTNVEFVQIVSTHEIDMRVWERGSGETLACGTGACAAAVAGVLNGLTPRNVRCNLPGGTLEIEWLPAGNVLLTGPAVEVFGGHWPDETGL